jgi:hypothetical protein
MKITLENALFAQTGRHLRVFAIVIGISVMTGNAHADNDTPPPKDFSKPYVERQTFKGKAFFKDNNDWVYTSAFAKTFGMPLENTYPELKGIEAAAFRIEERSYQDCGLGGKAENCTDEFRCVTDVYIDETKYPLPWATSEQSDWLSSYNSLQWLQAPNNDIGYYPKLPEGVRSGSSWPFERSLRPFADPDSHLEATLQENSNTPSLEDVDSNGVAIYGYKRKAIAGLTLLTLDYNCLHRNPEKHTVTFRLDSWEMFNGRRKVVKRFHEFQLPDVFHRKIDERAEARWAPELKRLKQSVNIK